MPNVHSQTLRSPCLGIGARPFSVEMLAKFGPRNRGQSEPGRVDLTAGGSAAVQATIAESIRRPGSKTRRTEDLLADADGVSLSDARPTAKQEAFPWHGLPAWVFSKRTSRL